MTKVLLDTNIIIHRETHRTLRSGIGELFYWLDQLKFEKHIHAVTIDEINKYKDPKIVSSFREKMKSYVLIENPAPDLPLIGELREALDKSVNDKNDTTLLNEVAVGRIDYLISEDSKLEQKVELLGIKHRVFTIDRFLEKVKEENPSLVNYSILSVKKGKFGDVNLKDEFFDSFRKDYAGFDNWFIRKFNEPVYYCKGSKGELLAFLYLKREGHSEPYYDIEPKFGKKNRLKIGTFKVRKNGFNLGERFVKIIFDNAMLFRVDEIYVTIFDDDQYKVKLINLLKQWGFKYFGSKKTSNGTEVVLTRNLTKPGSGDDLPPPKLLFPYINAKVNKWIVPIKPKYHTELLPDSILNNESSELYKEDRPHRNALSKLYISRTRVRGIQPGDLLIFYRSKIPNTNGLYTSVITTLAVITDIGYKFSCEEEFISYCEKRSLFSRDELSLGWRAKNKTRPIALKFISAFTFPTGKRLNLKSLLSNEILLEPPRTLTEFSHIQFQKLMEKTDVGSNIIVD